MLHHTILTSKGGANITELIPKSCPEQPVAIKSTSFRIAKNLPSK